MGHREIGHKSKYTKKVYFLVYFDVGVSRRWPISAETHSKQIFQVKIKK
jgi:hypothetical protein